MRKRARQSVANELIRIIALRVGHLPLQNVQTTRVPKDKNDGECLKPIWRSQLEEMRVEASRWVIIFYGRDTPATSSGWGNDLWTKEDDKIMNMFMEFLRGDLEFHVIHTPHSESRLSRKSQIVTDVIDSKRLNSKNAEGHASVSLHKEFCLEAIDRVEEESASIDWSKKPEETYSARVSILADILQSLKDLLLFDQDDDRGTRLRGSYGRLRFYCVLPVSMQKALAACASEG